MAKTLAVDKNNDIYLDANNNIAIATELTAVLQACEQAAKTYLGEMVLSTDKGIPYYEVVFVGVTNIQQFKSSLRQAFLEVTGVTQVKSISITQADDLLTYTATIETIYGVGTIPGVIGDDTIDITQPNLATLNYNYITEKGVIIPDTPAIYGNVQQEYKDVFGTDLITTANTPQGVLIVTDTLARSATAANNAQLANQINPNEAGGVFLDAIGALTGLERTKNEFTTVGVDLTGVEGTQIPAGTLFQDSISGYQFALQSSITLDESGEGNGIAKCTTAGAITVSPGNITVIVAGAPLGLETVNNPAAQIYIGSQREPDEQYRNRRRQTLALQGSSLSEAIVSAVRGLGGSVKSLSYRENWDKETKVIDGVTMVANSIYVCVDGGNDDEIADKIQIKTAGLNYNGDVNVNVKDPYSGQVIPVKFDRPNEIKISVRATIKPDQATQDPETAVKKAIDDYAKGNLSEEQGLIVGQAVSPWELAGAVNREYPGIFIQDMEISLVNQLNYTRDNIAIAINEVARIDEQNIAVVIMP